MDTNSCSWAHNFNSYDLRKQQMVSRPEHWYTGIIPVQDHCLCDAAPVCLAKNQKQAIMPKLNVEAITRQSMRGDSFTMLQGNEKDGKRVVIVVLDEGTISNGKNGLAPLRCALREGVGPGGEVLVLTILNSPQAPTPSPVNGGYCCLGDNRNYSNHPSGDQGRDIYIKFLRREINRRTDSYKRVFRPFYDGCTSSGVKFVVKIAAGYQLPKALIVEEANNVNDLPFHPSLFASTSRVSEILTRTDDQSSEESEIDSPENTKQATKGTVIDERMSCRKSSEVEHELGMPVQLSWEVISEITGGFRNMIGIDLNANFQLYSGYLSDNHSQVLVKRFTGDNGGILLAEMKAAFSLYHKNIMGLIGYHENENATVLVFPYTRRGTLDRYINGTRGKQPQLSFENKLEIAVGIAQGLRYMHEECPRGPVAHGDLQACNVFVSYDLQPQAQPLLRQRAYHELFDEEMDMYVMYRVRYAAAQCIKTNPISRPCMSEVVSFLKGETSCTTEWSSSLEGSPVIDLSTWLKLKLNL
ncbi:hypothetical protein RJ639_018712 [Escallonia herrerae]|uniref:Protein kinase domain-containing protein n=1 Tax=Escallonia herrerae TaxID=1293975 RepID=A0AA88V9U1_9ASTE|nr:hypothetical protein RJ639_018712 [Escallonia herrerae]